MRPLALLSLLLVVFVGSGSSCPNMMRQSYPEPPKVLPPQANLQQVIQAVNYNESQIRSFSTSNARLSGNGFPSLSANIAFERPRKFRLRADYGLMGPQVDLGSNDELFWFWVRQGQPPSLYFCRHDQFATSNFRRLMPVEPEWLIEAMGVTSFDPNVQHQGPVPVSGGRLEIRSPRSTAAGSFTKITILNEQTAAILEQHLYDARGQRIASAITSKHRYDPALHVTMPQHVEIQWPANNVSLNIDYSDFQLNNPAVAQGPTFAKPDYQGYANVDLAQPNPQFSGLMNNAAPTGSAPMTPLPSPSFAPATAGPTSANPATTPPPTTAANPGAVLSPLR